MTQSREVEDDGAAPAETLDAENRRLKGENAGLSGSVPFREKWRTLCACIPVKSAYIERNLDP